MGGYCGPGLEVEKDGAEKANEGGNEGLPLP